jgi:hypothetical protein
MFLNRLILTNKKGLKSFMKREELLQTVDIKDFSSWKQIILDDQKLLETLEKLQIKPSHLPRYTIDELKDELKDKMDFPKRIILEIEDLMEEIKDEIERRDAEKKNQNLKQKKEDQKVEKEVLEEKFKIEQERFKIEQYGESEILRKDWTTFYSSHPEFGNKDFLEEVIPFHVQLNLTSNAVLNGTMNVEDYLRGLKNSLYFDSVLKYFQNQNSKKRGRTVELIEDNSTKKQKTHEILCKCLCEECKKNNLDIKLPFHKSVCPNDHNHKVSSRNHNCMSGCVTTRLNKTINTQVMRVSYNGLVNRSISKEKHLEMYKSQEEIQFEKNFNFEFEFNDFTDLEQIFDAH